MKVDITATLRAWVLSTVVTRVIKAPKLDLAIRTVGEPEIVEVPTRHGKVRCYITRPANSAPLAVTNSPPVHVNIHGGAFLIGAPRQDDQLVRAIAANVGAVVVNIDYSTGPRVRFPRAHEECFDVFEWVREVGERMGWDSSRISIGGGSAGGNLALGVLELLRRSGGAAVRTGVLTVPLVDATTPPEQYAAYPGKPFIGPALVRAVNATYFADESRRTDPLASPALAGDDMSNLPPLLVLAAEKDSLRPDIERFVANARNAGVSVIYEVIAGVDHDFPVMTSEANNAAQRVAVDLIVENLTRQLS